MCARVDPSFMTVKALGQELTPYAVELRYDEEFWPSGETAREALEAATTIRGFVLDGLPAMTDPAEP